MALFKRQPRTRADGAALGGAAIALRLDDGDLKPEGCVLVIFDAGGRARRALPARVARAHDDVAYGYHPGPYEFDLVPFAAAPELGLRLRFVVDAADPRVELQRFELFLFSEAPALLTLADFGAALQAALQVALAQGQLELPPCTTTDEWSAFRAGLNQLLYTRFGVTVDDCVPVDLGERVDFAALLRARAQVTPVAPVRGVTSAVAPATPPVPGAAQQAAPQAPVPAAADADARALRRLFLELPAVSGALRLIALPPGQSPFQARQRLLQRLDLLSLSASTMPSLGWAAPDQPLDARQQGRRAGASAAALLALDEAWALLARFQLSDGAQSLALLDEADRILANLEHNLSMRRAPFAPLPLDERREPS